MSVTINGTSGLVFNDSSAQNTAATGFGFKNRKHAIASRRAYGVKSAKPRNTHV